MSNKHFKKHQKQLDAYSPPVQHSGLQAGDESRQGICSRNPGLQAKERLHQPPTAEKRPPTESGKINVTIHGMHCASCEVLIERKLTRIEGITSARVNHATGLAQVTYTNQPTIGQFQAALADTEYTVAAEPTDGQPSHPPKRTTARDYQETFWVFLIILVLYLVFRQFDLVPKGLSVSDNMSYGFIFVIGLVAAVSSCIAVTGGLLLAVAGRYAELHPNQSGLKKFRPHLFFNAGRVVGYTVFGGLIGAVGSVFTLSTRLTGVLMIAASLVMIFLGFQLLNVFPKLRQFQPKMPKCIAHRVHDASTGSDHPVAPFLLGATTFFLPCGFTQALQLFVLAKGSFTVGALTMLAFSLGTLPALLSLSALSSFLKGTTERYFFRFAGAIVVILGLINIGNGFSLAGTNLNLSKVFAKSTLDSQATTELPPLSNGTQVISMKVLGLEYQPSQFTVRQGIPVEWHIDGTKTAGCSSVVTDQGLKITAALPKSGEKVVNFTPTEIGVFPFSCPMGMTTRGAAITVVANDQTSATPTPSASTSPSPVPSPSVSPSDAAVQKFTLTATAEQGFFPTSFTAKKNLPVELTVDVQTDIGGCMSTMIGSDYDIAAELNPGLNVVRFTPTKAGKLKLTCPMGVPITEFIITE